MAPGLFDKQASVYAEARPTYPREWYSKLASLTAHHGVAWDVGTGNGQAAVNVAEYYDRVIGTDISEAQLMHAIPHPKVQYTHTPLLSTSNEELISLLGGEGSVDLVTVAEAVHWFDHPSFYSVVTRVLRKPGGVIAVWGYNDLKINLPNNTSFDDIMDRLLDTAHPYWDRNIHYLSNGYRTLPFPFQSVGLGCEGDPVSFDMDKDLSFQGFLGMLRSLSAVTTAKDRGVDLISEEMVKELETAWGGSSVIRLITYKAFMLAGTPKKLEEARN